MVQHQPLNLDYSSNTYFSCEVTSSTALQQLDASQGATSRPASDALSDKPSVCAQLKRLGPLGADSMASTEVVCLEGIPSGSQSKDIDTVSATLYCVCLVDSSFRLRAGWNRVKGSQQYK